MSPRINKINKQIHTYKNDDKQVPYAEIGVSFQQ